MRPEDIAFLVQRSLYGMNPKTPKTFWNTEHLGLPVTEKKPSDVESAYPCQPEYKSVFPTMRVDLGNVDVSREIGMLQGYTFAKREMEAKQVKQRIRYLGLPQNQQSILRYVEDDIKQTMKLSKEMNDMSTHKGYFEIDRVMFNTPATIVFWKDGTKTVVKAQKGDKFDPEKGLAMAFAKRALGDKGNYYNVFLKHLPKTKVVKKTTKKSATTRKKAAKQTTEDKVMDLAVASGLVVNTDTGEKFIVEPKLNKPSRRTKNEAGKK